MSEVSLPEGRMPVLRVPARPRDANMGGTIFGGWIMSHVDIAGSIPALELSLIHISEPTRLKTRSRMPSCA